MQFFTSWEKRRYWSSLMMNFQSPTMDSFKNQKWKDSKNDFIYWIRILRIKKKSYVKRINMKCFPTYWYIIVVRVKLYQWMCNLIGTSSREVLEVDNFSVNQIEWAVITFRKIECIVNIVWMYIVTICSTYLDILT